MSDVTPTNIHEPRERDRHTPECLVPLAFSFTRPPPFLPTGHPKTERTPDSGRFRPESGVLSVKGCPLGNQEDCRWRATSVA